MKGPIKLHLWDHDFELGIEVQKYLYGGGLALFLHCLEKGKPVEPFADMTVNLQMYPTTGSKAFVDVNNFPQVVELIENNRLGHLTGRVGQSGFCAYPEVEFDLKEVGKYALNVDSLNKIMSEHIAVER